MNENYASDITLEELAEIGEAWAMIIQHILAWCLKSMKGLHRRTAEKGMVQAWHGSMDAVDVVGYHYKTADDRNGGMKWLAEEVDKEVWNSEEQYSSPYNGSFAAPNSWWKSFSIFSLTASFS